VKQDPKKKEYMMLSHEIRPYTVMSPRDFLIDNRYFEQPDVYRNETACIFMFDDRFMTQEFSEIEINTESFYAGTTASNFESTDIVLLTIAPELYFYHSTYLCHGKSCDSEIPIDMSVDASEVYSNITNGLGIFAAYSKSRFALTPVSLTHN
jgi:hypothetical protein